MDEDKSQYFRVYYEAKSRKDRLVLNETLREKPFNHLRISINFRGRGNEDSGVDPFGQSEHVDRSHGVRLDRLHRVVHVVGRGRW